MISIRELARLTGLSSRTLRHYEQIGLCQPQGRTPAGYRLYGPEALERIRMILQLQSCGLSLGRIRMLLEGGVSPLALVLEQRSRLETQIASLQNLHARLSQLAAVLHSAGSPATAETLQIIEVMVMLKNHLDAQEHLALEAIHHRLGEARLKEAHDELNSLVREMATLHAAGASVSESRVVSAAKRLRGLLAEFTEGSRELQTTLLAAHEAFWGHAGEPVSRELASYLARALADQAS